ncbi:MAG: lamin tail domain-containing protein, partial [candidate division KSB1 bacterium]|nr:lamin tail domain-containing protein [candidate division KSB1 bacterium]
PVPVLVPVPALPALNNDFDAVSLYDLTGQIIDSLAYFSSWGSRYGVSLERIYWERKTQDSTNWRLSSAALGATPGQVNSASPFEVDLAISPQGISFEPAQPKFGQEVLVSVEIKNVGRESVSGYKVRFFDDANQDSVLQEIEELVAPVLSYEVLANEVSQVIQVTLEPLSSGIHSLYILVEHPWDQNRNNDSASVELKVGFLAGDVIINEIMYAPLAGYGEWVELYNPSLKSINLRQWSLADADALVSLGNRSIELPPAGYAVIAADSSVRDFFGPFTAPLLIPSKSLPALNNDFDTIMILDFNGNRIDSLTYYSSWGGEQGVSLERINPRLSSTDSSNWSSCVFAKGGTPGERNSIFTQVVPASTELSISPNPFSPDSDGRDDFAVISYSLPLTTASVNIKIFDVRGRLVRTLFNNEPSGAQRSVIWDGRDDNNQVLRMGIYIVYLEALNSLAGVIQTAKKTVVLAKKL